MTIKEILLNKIEELNIVKSSLLKVDIFLNPDNDAFVYHTLNIGKISGTTGSTPNNLSEILDTVVASINEYAQYIQKMPYAESNVILRNRDTKQYAVFSNKGLVPGRVSWTEMSSEASFESIQQYLPMSTYKGFVKTMKIVCRPSFRKGSPDANNINFDVIVYRINTRLNLKEVYSANGIEVSVTFDSDHLYGDDIFIIGFKPITKIILTSIYYSDLSYSIDIEGEDGSKNSIIRAINDISPGGMQPDVDTSVNDGILMWDIFTLNDFSVELIDTAGKSAYIIPDNYSGTNGTGVTIDSISVDGFSLDLSSEKISCKPGSFKAIGSLIDDTYSLYDKNVSNIAHIVFKNIRPIDIVLSEAINAL